MLSVTMFVYRREISAAFNSNLGPSVRRAWRRCIAWHVIERGLTGVEIWIFAYGLGQRLSLGQTLFLSAAMTGFTLVFFFIPAQAGAAEGGLSLASAALGFNPMLGLSIALFRRGRQLFVGIVGLAFLLIFERDVLRNFRRPTPIATASSVGDELVT